MRKRIVCVLAVMLVTLGAMPFGASAAAPNIARVSAASWQDMLGREVNALCETGGVGSAGTQGIGPSVQTTVRFSGVVA